MSFGPSKCLLWRNVYLDLPIFEFFFFFFYIELHKLFVYFGITPLSVALFVNNFLLFEGCFCFV